MEFPFLTLIALSPIIAAVIILMLPKERGENARMIGLAAMVLNLVLALYVYFYYHQNLPEPGLPWAQTLDVLRRAYVDPQYWNQLHHGC